VAGPAEIAIIGPADDERTKALHLAAGLGAGPGAVIATGPGGGDGTGMVPLLTGRDLVDGQPAAYVCRDFACLLPVTTAAELLAVLRS
jgi:uncharacterized protein YyaL (SSP411 family)